MKKIILLSCVMLSAILAFAQQTKKVAIIDVIDRDNALTYSTKMMVRSMLGEAVSNMSGYESYERSDIDAIMNEQNFQRTGLISDDQIRRLGEMSGVTYILLTEVVNASEKELFISSKVLNVETAKMISSATATCVSQPANIRTACNSIVEKLLGMKDAGKGIAQEGWRHEGFDSNYITKIERNEYKYGNKILEGKEYELFLKNNCPDAWKKYRSGQKAVTAGWSLFGSGVALTAVGLTIGFVDRGETSLTYGGYAGILIGVPSAVAGIISFSVGYKYKANAYKIYNVNCASRQASMSLNLQSSQNGIGLALVF